MTSAMKVINDITTPTKSKTKQLLKFLRLMRTSFGFSKHRSLNEKKSLNHFATKPVSISAIVLN